MIRPRNDTELTPDTAHNTLQLLQRTELILITTDDEPYPLFKTGKIKLDKINGRRDQNNIGKLILVR